jgi:site-specific DNA-methyltransferase (adenine-specific)
VSGWQVVEADCVEAMAAMDEASIDAIVTDPPYGLEFMGKEWDSFGRFDARDKAEKSASRNRENAPVGASPTYVGGAAAQTWHQAWAVEALRVLKPGGHLLAFGGTRTYHRLTCGLEDAGFEIRDCLAWLYGSGFPKSLDVSKAIDKAAGAEREVVGGKPGNACDGNPCACDTDGRSYSPTKHSALTLAATPDAERWQGWGTALKPAHEPIVLARKPLIGTVAANVLEHGTGALNIDGTRIGIDGPDDRTAGRPTATFGNQQTVSGGDGSGGWAAPDGLGRWPSNVLLDERAAEMLDEQSGESSSRIGKPRGGTPGPGWGIGTQVGSEYDDFGGASRFFYTAKAGRDEREGHPGYRDGGVGERHNSHPTVKPIALMTWLVRLVTPPGGIVLDPFAGSGSTGVAALREGFDFIGIEREAEYVEIARARIFGDGPLLNVEVAP